MLRFPSTYTPLTRHVVRTWCASWDSAHLFISSLLCFRCECSMEMCM